MVAFRCLRGMLIGLVIASLGACAHSDKEKSKGEKAAAAEPPAAVHRTAQDYEDALRDLVRNGINAASRSADEQKGRVVKRNPYFFKQYEIYPDGADDMKVVMQETESRSAPYIADVTVAKQRFATRYHRKRAEAEDDMNFLRDTGSETVTYEVRNGRWMRVGSLFVASKSEENVNGEWLPVKETVKRTVASEEEQSVGFFKRMWRKVAGTSEDTGKAKSAKGNELKPANPTPKKLKMQEY